MSHRTHYLLVNVAGSKTREEIEEKAIAAAEETLSVHLNFTCDSYEIICYIDRSDEQKEHYPNGVIIGKIDPDYLIKTVEGCAENISNEFDYAYRNHRKHKEEGNEWCSWYFMKICSEIKLGDYIFETGLFDIEDWTSEVDLEKVRDHPEDYALAVYDLHI